MLLTKNHGTYSKTKIGEDMANGTNIRNNPVGTICVLDFSAVIDDVLFSYNLFTYITITYLLITIITNISYFYLSLISIYTPKK